MEGDCGTGTIEVLECYSDFSYFPFKICSLADLVGTRLLFIIVYYSFPFKCFIYLKNMGKSQEPAASLKCVAGFSVTSVSFFKSIRPQSFSQVFKPMIDFLLQDRLSVSGTFVS